VRSLTSELPDPPQQRNGAATASVRSAAAALAVGLALAGACIAAQGPLPGDVALTRALQALFGEAPPWAAPITRSAKAPGVWLTLAVAVALAGARGGARGAALPPLALLAAWAVDTLLRALVFAPKPSPEIVAVAAASSASGLPSTFALVYGGLFGAVIATPPTRGAVATATAALAASFVAMGCAARLVLGGHWTSQMLASLAFAWAFVAALGLAMTRLRAVSGSRSRTRPL